VWLQYFIVITVIICLFCVWHRQFCTCN
jgi:hypothetical protein